MSVSTSRPVEASAPQAVPFRAVPVAESLNMDDRRSTRLGWLILLIGFGGFMLWALLAPLDEGAPLPGTVSLVGNRKTIQHPYGGVVESVLVREGDAVKTGDVLVKLNTTKTEADVNIVRSQWIAIKGAEARMLAERSGASRIVFPDWFAQNGADPRVQETIRVQSALFTARSQALNSELSSLRETENGLVRSLESMQQSTQQKQVQLRLSDEQLTGLREMERAGYLARNRLLEAERAHANLQALLADDQTQMARTTGSLGEVRMRMAQRRYETQKDLQGQLADAQRQVAELDNKLNAVQFDNRMAEVRAPVDGFVTGLQVFTQGGVVTPSTKLMELVPAQDRMEIAGQLAVHLVDKVQPGLPVTISFPALNVRKTPVLEGRVRTVSADRLTDEKTGIPYYLVKVDIPAESYAKLNGQVILPGMPADAFVKLGERTLMTYLLKPLTDRLRTSLSER